MASSSSQHQFNQQREKFRAELTHLLAEHHWPTTSRGEAHSIIFDWSEDELVLQEITTLAPQLVQAMIVTADPIMALRNWDRYARVSFNRASLLRLLVTNPGHLAFLARLFSFSQFFSDIVIRNPEYLEWCLVEAQIDREKPLERYEKQLRQFVRPFKSPDSRRRALCRFKRRELLRLGVRELLGHGSIREYCRELTNLAEAACHLAYEDSLGPLVERYGLPCPVDEVTTECAVKFAVIAMGKFGGQELNFSSDIDLNFIYDHEGRTQGVKDDNQGYTRGSITSHEFYCKLATAISTYLMDPTTEGVLYRVDTRLRPEGNAGSVARSIAAYVAYFADQARAWEKIAYLKARCVAGDPELGEIFHEIAASFVFSSNRPDVIFPEVARLKRRIDFEALDPKARKLDIKRGPGGIREIEFIVAANQLLHGMQDKNMRVRATLEGLARLVEAGRTPPADAIQFTEIYWFFRRVEHALQMMEEQQTHSLPESPEERRALAIRCGEPDAEAFERRLESSRRFVREKFEATFHEDGDPERLDLADVLQKQESPTPEVLHELAPYGIGTVEGFVALRELAMGTRDLAVSSAEQRNFEKLLPLLLDEVKHAAMPINAIHHLAQLFRAHHSISVLYEMILAHPPVLRMLLRVLGFSPLTARLMISHPGRLDRMIEGDALLANRSITQVFEDFLVPRIHAKPTEVQLSELRKFKDREALFIFAREILGICTATECARQTTELAEVCLHTVCELTAAETTAAGNWCLLGFGSFGGLQVHICSDLDVAFFCNMGDGDEHARLPADLHKLASGIISTMSAMSPEGQLWKMDARLRPDGVNAPLMVTIERARRYYREEAGLWEFQSATRTRHVAGNRKISSHVLAMIRETFRERSPWPNLGTEIKTMRRRMESSTKLPSSAAMDLKRSPGGLVDIEFLVQYFQLSHPDKPNLWTPNTEEALAALRVEGLFNETDASFIIEHYLTLRLIQRALRLQWETSRDFLPAKRDRLDILVRGLAPQMPNAQATIDMLLHRMIKMRNLFEKLIGE